MLPAGEAYRYTVLGFRSQEYRLAPTTPTDWRVGLHSSTSDTLMRGDGRGHLVEGGEQLLRLVDPG